MFRKITHIILIFLFLTAIMGFTVVKHNCNMESGKMMVLDNTQEPCAGWETPDCRLDETKYIHLVVDFVSRDTFQLKRIAKIVTSFPVVFSTKENHIEKIENIFSNFVKSPLQYDYSNNQAWLQTFLI